MTPVLLLLALANPSPPQLTSYLNRPKAPLELKVAETKDGWTRMEFQSQVWQGITWKHQLVEIIPDRALSESDAILFVTGDYRERGLAQMQQAARLARLPLYVVHDIPNQPLMDGKKEDALIAATFLQYLQTGDETWPLLFPMTQSAIRAMDAVQQRNPRIKRFIVSGASKRGWTTWLVGASRDKRVAGIAPMVIDVLNMPAQLAHQQKMFGKLSEEINDYSSTGLTQLLALPAGQALARMVDPYSYLSEIKVPKLIIVGANDPYWTVDAHNLYWNQVSEPKFMRVVPNAGHSLGDGLGAVESLAFFARGVMGHLPGGLPKGVDADRVSDSRLIRQQEWAAISDTYRFQESEWKDAQGQKVKAEQKKAVFKEFRFRDGDITASFTSRVTVWPPLPASK